MIGTSELLQKSIYAALNTGQYKIYEIVPDGVKVDYITIGDDILTSVSNKTDIRSRHNITIHTWYKSATSSKGSKTLNDFVIDRIYNHLSIDKMDRIELSMVRTLKEIEPDGTIFHGVIEFQIDIGE